MGEQNVTPLPAAQGARRGPRFTYSFPKKLRLQGDPESITFVHLTLEQDMDGNKLVEKTKNPFDKVKMAIVAFNGQPVDWASGRIDEIVSKASPKIRELILAAFIACSQPTEAEKNDFLEQVTAET